MVSALYRPIILMVDTIINFVSCLVFTHLNHWSCVAQIQNPHAPQHTDCYSFTHHPINSMNHYILNVKTTFLAGWEWAFFSLQLNSFLPCNYLFNSCFLCQTLRTSWQELRVFFLPLPTVSQRLSRQPVLLQALIKMIIITLIFLWNYLHF